MTSNSKTAKTKPQRAVPQVVTDSLRVSMLQDRLIWVEIFFDSLTAAQQRDLLAVLKKRQKRL